MFTKLEKPEQIISIDETSRIIATLLPCWRKFVKANEKRKANQIKNMIRSSLYACSESREADYISKSAKQLWEMDECLENFNLFYLTPHIARQHKKGNATLKLLVLEHCNPLSQVMIQIFQTKSNKQISAILKNELKTAWITKEENSKLGKKKYRNHRFPFDKNGKKAQKANWEECYKQCGIKTIEQK